MSLPQRDTAPGGTDDLRARYAALLQQMPPGPYRPRPQAAWGWQIAGYLYLGGLGAGIFAVGVVFDWLGFALPTARVSVIGDWAWEWPRLVFLLGPVLTAVGASLLVLDLGRNWRRFATAGLNPRTSWMARGFTILSAFIISAGAAAAVSVAAPETRESSLVIWRLLEGVGVVCALGTALYTGVLLRSMAPLPAWRPAALPPLFLASALSTGAMAIVLVVAAVGLLGVEPEVGERLVRAVERFEILVLALEAVFLALYVRDLSAGKPEARLSAHMILRGERRPAFWLGVVGCAVALPIALSLANLLLASVAVAAVAAVSVLVGGLMLRLLVLGIGVRERHPLYRLAEWRGEHAAVGSRYLGARNEMGADACADAC